MDGANLDVHPSKTLGIVGESGCGKSVAAKSISVDCRQAGPDRRRRDPPSLRQQSGAAAGSQSGWPARGCRKMKAIRRRDLDDLSGTDEFVQPNPHGW
ncbi:MAG: ATP-binding cassette domain-containing protein [Caldilineaceae bacterium]